MQVASTLVCKCMILSLCIRACYNTNNNYFLLMLFIALKGCMGAINAGGMMT